MRKLRGGLVAAAGRGSAATAIWLDTGLHVSSVLLDETFKGHVKIVVGFVELFALPRLCLALGLETALL